MTSSNEKGIGKSPGLNPRKSESVDDETRSEFAKLKTRLFILESKVEMLLSQSQSSKGKPMAKNDPSSVNPPVGHGHATPFTGDIKIIWLCAGVVLEKIKAQDFLSKELHQHLAQGYGEAATAFLKDGPPPVGVMGATAELDTLEDCEYALEGLLEAKKEGVGAAIDAANVNYLVWLDLFLRIAALIRDQLSK